MNPPISPSRTGGADGAAPAPLAAASSAGAGGAAAGGVAAGGAPASSAAAVRADDPAFISAFNKAPYRRKQR